MTTSTFIVFLVCVMRGACELNPNNITVSDNATDLIVFRVVNGKAANPGDVPWQVGFVVRSKRVYRVFCGGTVVKPTMIISAAHCFESKKKGINCNKGKVTRQELRGTMAVGGYMSATADKPYPDSDRGQWRSLRAARYPARYKFPEYDIAVVRTNNPFRINEFVAPIPMATKRAEYDVRCLASGYGRISNTKKSEILLLAEIKTVPTRQCTKLHGKDMSRFVCTSDAVSDVHKGDSGGPLVCKGVDRADRGKGVLVGVVSGKYIGVAGRTFFTRVTTYNKFLRGRASFKEPSLLFFTLTYVIHSGLAQF